MAATPTKRGTILDVPFAEKDEAKALGAKWDPDLRKWFVPEGIDLEDFTNWIPEGNEAKRQRATRE